MIGFPRYEMWVWGKPTSVMMLRWGESTGQAPGLTRNFLFLSVNFLFFIFYIRKQHTKTLTTAQKRNCTNSHVTCTVHGQAGFWKQCETHFMIRSWDTEDETAATVMEKRLQKMP